MQTIIKVTEDSMKKCINKLGDNLSTIRAGRATPAILDKVMVDYYGTMTSVQQMAAVSVSENRILVIQPWDKSSLGDIERALLKADLGITPTNDGTVVRLVFPQPTEERRKELTKEVRAIGEDAKVAVRNVRRDSNDQLKALKTKSEFSEDEISRTEKSVQELTDKFIKEIDGIITNKEKEVLEI